MKKEKIALDSFILVGLTVRTNNQNEMDPKTGKIAPLAGNYFHNQIANEFKNRTTPGITYAVYTDFESDENGEYTYFIGEKVDSLDDQDLSKFQSLVIPASSYQKFTTDSGKLPDIVISSWQEIWQMTEKDFEGKRKYLADFELYDQRAMDPTNAALDIYIGIDG